ncbi:MAG: dihydrolipoyl dehydrogenase [Saccharofermentanales bacterium]|jgi:dihydrolipoamide dehydrogenase
MKYDLIVLGGGPAGYLAAERAAAGGFSVLLLEKLNIGGVCLNEGCIPTKSFLHSVKLYDAARHSKGYGVQAEQVTLDHKKVVARKNKVVKMLVGGVRATLAQQKVTVVTGSGRISGRTAEGFTVTDGEQTYTGERVLIATGSEPALPPIYGLKETLASGFTLTSREILQMESLPDSLVIIGGGVIGLEFAAYFQTAGVDVTVIEMLDHIGGPIDHEIGEWLYKALKKKGVDFRLSSTVTEFREGAVTFRQNDNDIDVFCDKVLVSIGRRPSTAGLGLETIGVEMKGAAVVTDAQCRTSVPGVYAAGDVNGRSMLAHTAYREAEVAVANMLGEQDGVNYNTIAAVIYSSPELAGVGETEESAAAKGLDFRVQKCSMRYSGRFVAENEGGDGLCKLIVENGSERLLGLHLIGSYASEIIYSAVLMLEQQMTIPELQKTVFPHPTVGEAIREALFQA